VSLLAVRAWLDRELLVSTGRTLSLSLSGVGARPRDSAFYSTLGQAGPCGHSQDVKESQQGETAQRRPVGERRRARIPRGERRCHSSRLGRA